MQNEELREAQTELGIAKERYFNFYNLAPVGYITLSNSGLILGGQPRHLHPSRSDSR